MNEKVTIIGGGLAGSSAALALGKRGIKSVLYEMRPRKMTPAHSGGNLAELVCSNSMGSRETFSANGLLMAELAKLACPLLEIATKNTVPAGKALAIDRESFGREVTSAIESNPFIELVRDEISSIPSDGFVIIASGPLTSDSLIEDIKRITGGSALYFFDATSPTVALDSIDILKAFWGNRRDPNGADYLNCPMNEVEFKAFCDALKDAERTEIRDFEPDKLFEACLPVELLVQRDYEALRFGPLKPVGLKDPNTGKRPHAIVQLRREDSAGEYLNLVGFQTRLKYAEQKRVFSMIPALKNARWVRLGHMHKNFYFDAPRLLDEFLRLKSDNRIFLAGQITGGEGYLEAVSQGFSSACHIAMMFRDSEPMIFPEVSLLGAFPRALVSSKAECYQPQKVSFGMLPPLNENIRGRRPRREKLVARSISALDEFIEKYKP